jgi:hypothetical protein
MYVCCAILSFSRKLEGNKRRKQKYFTEKFLVIFFYVITQKIFVSKWRGKEYCGYEKESKEKKLQK